MIRDSGIPFWVISQNVVNKKEQFRMFYHPILPW